MSAHDGSFCKSLNSLCIKKIVTEFILSLAVIWICFSRPVHQQTVELRREFVSAFDVPAAIL